MSKSLSQDPDQYNAKAAHVELASRMRTRDPATGPAVGDRIPYVIVKGHKASKAYERGEDPLVVLEKRLPIDSNYYLENMLKKPLLRIFEPVLPNAEKELFRGDHTRAVVQSAGAKSAPTGIMKFVKEVPHCLGCKAPLAGGGGSVLCSSCEDRAPDIYVDKLNEANRKREEFNRLWVNCQRCQGSIAQEVLCSNRDCDMFYRRVKARHDAEDAEKLMEKLSW